MTEKRILIVDYSSQSLDSLAQLFKSHKFQIIKATDGNSAYEKFKSERPDLVILEAMLPKLHGFDLTKKISQETKGKIPIIIVTGVYKGPHFKHEALTSLGASDYFEKPFDKEKLVSAVLNLLNEEPDIQEELPNSKSIIENLSRRIKARMDKSFLKSK
jgi:DNA-binding response OmpR family regulator